MKVLLKKVSAYTFMVLFIIQTFFGKGIQASFREEDVFATYGNPHALHIFIDLFETPPGREKQLHVHIGTEDVTVGAGEAGEKLPLNFIGNPLVGSKLHVRNTGRTSSVPLCNDLQMNLNGLKLTLNQEGRLNLRGTARDSLKKVFIYSSLLLDLEDVRTEFLGVTAPMVTNRGSTHINMLEMRANNAKGTLTPLHNKGILKLQEGLGVDLRNSGEAILDRGQSEITTYLRPDHALRIKIKNERESTLVLKNGEFNATGNYGLVNEGILVQENSLLAWTPASRWPSPGASHAPQRVNLGKWVTRSPTVLTLPSPEDMGVMEIGGELKVESPTANAIEVLDGLKQVEAASIEITAKTLETQEPKTYPWPIKLNIRDEISLQADLRASSWEVYVGGSPLNETLLHRFALLKKGNSQEGEEDQPDPTSLEEQEFEAKCLATLIHMDATKIPPKMLEVGEPAEAIDMDAVLEEAISTEDWNRRMDIIGDLGRRVIKGDTPEEALPFENYLREKISRFDQPFARFLTYFLEFISLQCLPLEQRRGAVKKAIPLGKLGRGAFLLKALDYVDGKDFESLEEINDYADRILGMLPKALPYSTAYRHIVELNKHEYQHYNSLETITDRVALWEGYHNCLENLYRDLATDGQQVVGWYFVTKHPYWWRPLFNTLLEERQDKHYDLLREALMGIVKPTLRQRLMKRFLKAFLFPFDPVKRTPELEGLHPMIGRLQEVADRVGFSGFEVHKILSAREKQIKNGSSLPAAEEERWRADVKNELEHISITYPSSFEGLYARVLLAQLDMNSPTTRGGPQLTTDEQGRSVYQFTSWWAGCLSLKDFEPLLREIRELPESKGKYKLLAALIDTGYKSPQRSDFEVYMTGLRCLIGVFHRNNRKRTLTPGTPLLVRI